MHLGLAKLVNCNQILGHVTDQDCIEFIDSVHEQNSRFHAVGHSLANQVSIRVQLISTSCTIVNSVCFDHKLAELDIIASNVVVADYLDQIDSSRLNGVFPKLCKLI